MPTETPLPPSDPKPSYVKQGLETDVQFLKGVGPKNASLLAKAGLRTVRDVLYHLPRRYEDRRNMPRIADLRPGQFATVRANFDRIETRTTRGGKVILRAWLSDRSGGIALTWFNQPWIRRKFEKHEGQVIAYGMIKEADWGLEIGNPEFELVEPDDDVDEFARIVPVYPLVEGLPQRLVRKAIRSAIEGYVGFAPDILPEGLRSRFQIRPLGWSLRQIHAPESEEFRLEARRRLVFEDFLYLQLALAMKREKGKHELGTSIPVRELVEGKLGPRLWDELRSILPFELTGAQKRVIKEIWADLERPFPMNRLVQGDVGSGKTAVAACAMLAAVRAGYQVALMAPTEILAEQHASSLHALFQPIGVEVLLLVGKQTAAEKKRVRKRFEAGGPCVAVGTHALIQEGVSFEQLGLIVVDEQHRFGVMQRAALREKGLGNPDVLVMTATPIPRTLTMTLYGDLDVSVIDEMPPGRKAIKTHWKLTRERPGVYQAVRKLIEEGRQAYFVCPLVSESESMLAQAAEDLHYRLSTEVYPDLRVGILHGQLKPKDKEAAMAAFRGGELDILVGTTVIEVGVDVPNACVMVIEDANRFGLSQLHQLRGRVGRGSHQSYCILVGEAKADDARARMDVMVSTSDGFKIAEEDLRLRGPGEILGTRQSGNLDLKIADLVQDAKMLEVARTAAIELIEGDPSLARKDHAGLLEQVTLRGSASWAAV